MDTSPDTIYNVDSASGSGRHMSRLYSTMEGVKVTIEAIMDHNDHVELIRSAVPEGTRVWADLGSGEGAFTLALTEVAGSDITVYSVDKNAERLRRQKEHFKLMFPEADVHYMHTDFTKQMDLPQLDGIVMANSLHFIKNKGELLAALSRYLKPGGKLIVIEYNSDEGNLWIPHAISYEAFRTLARGAGFNDVKLCTSVPSITLGEIYCACATR